MIMTICVSGPCITSIKINNDERFNIEFISSFSRDHLIEPSLQVQPILFQFVAENSPSTQIPTIILMKSFIRAVAPVAMCEGALRFSIKGHTLDRFITWK